MNHTARRYAAALSLTLVLAAAPSTLAGPRDGRDRDTTPIVKIVRSLLRFIGITVTAEPAGPPPSPGASNDKP